MSWARNFLVIQIFSCQGRRKDPKLWKERTESNRPNQCSLSVRSASVYCLKKHDDLFSMTGLSGRVSYVLRKWEHYLTLFCADERKTFHNKIVRLYRPNRIVRITWLFENAHWPLKSMPVFGAPKQKQLKTNGVSGETQYQLSKNSKKTWALAFLRNPAILTGFQLFQSVSVVAVRWTIEATIIV